MGIHVPQTLLNVSEEVKVKIKIDKLTDRQLKNIARQVKAGYIPAYANSATAHIARHLVDVFSVPCIRWSSWRLDATNIPTDHPIYDAVINAASMSKLEDTERASWYKGDLDAVMEQAGKKDTLRVSMYLFSETGRKMLAEAGKKGVVTPDNSVHAYLDKLLNREIDYVEITPS